MLEREPVLKRVLGSSPEERECAEGERASGGESCGGPGRRVVEAGGGDRQRGRSSSPGSLHGTRSSGMHRDSSELIKQDSITCRQLSFSYSHLQTTPCLLYESPSITVYPYDIISQQVIKRENCSAT